MRPPSDEWYAVTSLVVGTPTSLPRVVDEAIAAGIIGLDSESRPRPGIAYSGLDVRPWSPIPRDGSKRAAIEPLALEDTRARLAGLCLAVSPDTGYYYPLCHDVGENISPELALSEFGRLGDAIKDGRVVAAMWHSPFDQAMLGRLLGIQRWPEGSFVDGEILDRVLRPFAKSHGLKRSVASALGLQMLEFAAPRKEVWVTELADHPLFKPRPNMGMDFGALDPNECARYAAGDAVCTLRYVLAALKRNVSDKLASIVALEHDFVGAVRALPRTQVGYDRAHVLALADQFLAEQRTLAAQLEAAGCTKLTTNGFAEALAARGYTGESTGKADLKLIPQTPATHDLYELAQQIRRYRTVSVYLASYLSPIINADNEHELCGRWSASAAKSGRMTAGPQKGQRKDDQHIFATWMPHGMPRRKEFRSIVVARPGYVIIKADFASEEYRVCAVLARAPSWLEVFQRPTLKEQDVHAHTAERLFASFKTLDPQNSLHAAEWDRLRSSGKTFNFAAIYGAQAPCIASLLSCSVDDAQAQLDRFYAMEPALQRYQEECQAQAREYGRVFTYYGRPIAVRDTDTVEDDDGLKLHATVNYVVQGSCADILKLAVTRFMHEQAPSLEIYGGDDSVRLINLVHDEVVVEAREEKANDVAAHLARCMEGAAPREWPIRLPVEISIGPRWGS